MLKNTAVFGDGLWFVATAGVEHKFFSKKKKSKEKQQDLICVIVAFSLTLTREKVTSRRNRLTFNETARLLWRLNRNNDVRQKGAKWTETHVSCSDGS